MEQPIVSVIIPVYNTGTEAEKLIRSLLRGQYENLEIIAVDDGSTDDSLRVLKGIADAKGRLKVLHRRNGGASAARNTGLKAANGEYVAFVDSDDMVAEDFFRKMVEMLEGSEATMAVSAYRYHRVRQDTEFDLYTNAVTERKEGESYKAYILRLIATDGRLYAVINKIFRMEIIKEHGLRFDTKLNFAEDLKFVLDYLKCADEGEIGFVLEPLYYYNYGTETSTVAESSLPWGNWEASFENLRKWVGPTPTREEERRLKLVRRRWEISHALAVARANKAWGEKLKYAKWWQLGPAEVVVKLRK